MISIWLTYINSGRGWDFLTVLSTSEYPTRRSAEVYVKDYAYSLQREHEWEFTPKTAVVPDLMEDK